MITLRDAILHSAGANAAHGLRRTNANKRRAVLMLLQDDGWGQWSDREIGRQCVVDGKTVRRLREEFGQQHLGISQDAPRTVSRGGKVYSMDTGRIGRQQPEPEPPAVPASGNLGVGLNLAGVEALPHGVERFLPAFALARERQARKRRHGGYHGIVGLPVHPAALSRPLRNLLNEEPQLGSNILAHRIPQSSCVALYARARSRALYFVKVPTHGRVFSVGQVNSC